MLLNLSFKNADLKLGSFEDMTIFVGKKISFNLNSNHSIYEKDNAVAYAQLVFRVA